MLDNESDDVIDVTKPETTPLFQTSPERIGLAIGDEPEDWCGDFHDAVDVTWFEGDAAQAPVSVCIQYVREDLYDFVIGERNNLSTLWGESLRTVADLRAALSERDRMLGEAVELVRAAREWGVRDKYGEEIEAFEDESAAFLAAYDASKKEKV